jgi:hypothetical protein
MVKYPHMRKELIFSIRTLADPVYQRRVWVDLELPRTPFEDCFDMAIHIIFDDLCLNTNLDQAIGPVLRNDTEAQAVQRLVEKIDILFDRMGLSATDQEYINSPYWPDVLEAASAAYEVLTGGQKPQSMFEDVQKGWMLKF